MQLKLVTLLESRLPRYADEPRVITVITMVATIMMIVIILVDADVGVMTPSAALMIIMPMMVPMVSAL